MSVSIQSTYRSFSSFPFFIKISIALVGAIGLWSVGPAAQAACPGGGTWYLDMDGDGYGDPGTATTSCDIPTGTAVDGGYAFTEGSHELTVWGNGTATYTDMSRDWWNADGGCSQLNYGGYTDRRLPTSQEAGAMDGHESDLYLDDSRYGDYRIDTDNYRYNNIYNYYGGYIDTQPTNSNTNTKFKCVRDGVPSINHVTNNTDCDDTDAAFNPDTVRYKDTDGDGYSDSTTLAQCSRPTGYKLASELTATSGDCDDTDAALNPDTVRYQDADADGYSDGTTLAQCTDPGTDYYLFADMIDNLATPTTIYDGLMGWWTFDDGTATDQSGNGNDGTEVGTTTTTGQLGDAKEFALGDKIEMTSLSEDPGANNTITVAAWIRPTGGSTNAPIVRIDKFYFQFYSQDRLATYRYGRSSPGYHYSTINSVPLNTWTHVAVVWSTSDVKFYINGQLNRTKSTSGVGQANSRMNIGYENNSRKYQGKIDDVRVYNRPLSASEIQEVYTTTNEYMDGDCNDTSDRAYPGGNEVCDGLDNDCNGQVDDITQIPVAECEALVDLYHSTSGDNWIDNTGWLTDANIDNWYGVSAWAGYIDGLTLSNNNLVGPLPPTIGQLTNLGRLSLDNNQLTSLSTGFGQLTNLERLYLNDNQISSLPTTFGQLTALQQVILDNNQLTSLPTTFGQLTNLHRLELENNQLTSLPTTFGQLQALDNLDLKHNQLTSLPTQIGQLSNLAHLYLRDNQLTSLPAEIGQLSSLVELSLLNNQLTSLPTEIGQLANLQRLYINNNQLTALPPSIGQLSSIKELHLANNEITTIPLEIGQLSTLERLTVSANNLPRTTAHNRAVPSSIQAWYNTLLNADIYDQGDITPPVLTGQTTIPATITGAFSYTFEIEENSYAVDSASNPMSINFAGPEICSDLTTTDTVSTQAGQVTITITPTTQGTYENCVLEVIDHGDEPGNGYSIANIGELNLSTFCYGQILYADTDGDGYGDPTTSIQACGTTSGYVADATDCDDTDTAINPGATEVCNEIDMDCSGSPHDVSQIPVAECAALVDLYTDTGGDTWTDNTGWLTAADINTWYGVILSGGYVGEIDLYYNNVVGTLPITIGQLSNLSVFDLARNKLTSLPVEFGQLNDLQTLSLNNNQLTSIPSELGQLSSLKTLYLSNNKLINIPAGLGNLSNLEVLYLDDNQLTSIPVELGNLSNLGQLALEDNQLMSIPTELGQLDSLYSLHLDDNQLTSIPAGLGDLSNLGSLYLQNNQLTSIPAELGQLSSLRSLYLQNNQLTSIPAELGQLSSLQSLDAKNNQLTSVPAELGQLNTLYSLYLNNNQLTSIPIELGQLSRLNTLYVSANNLPRTPVYDRSIPPSIQVWYDAIASYRKSISNQGDITPPILTGVSTISAAVTGAFSYTFEIDENSFAVDNANNPMPISFSGPGLCTSLTTTDSVSVSAGQVTITITPSTQGTYSDCVLQVTDHGDELGNGHSTPNVGTIILDTFCYGGTAYADLDGDGYGDPNAGVGVCGAPGSGQVSNNTDCDDTHFGINPDTVWYLDADADGFADGSDNRTQCTMPSANHYLMADLLGSAAAQSTLNNGLVGYWNFDDGTATDQSGNGNDGTLQGNTQPTTGKLATAMSFDGNGDRVSISDNSAFDGIRQEMTVTLWVQPGRQYDSGLSKYVSLIEKQATNISADDFLLAINPDGRLHFGTNGGNMQSTKNTWNTDEWYFVVATYRNDLSGEIYINGIEEALTVNNLDTFSNTNADIWIGGGSSSNRQHFNGSIDDVRIYDRALTPTEIEDLYLATTAYAGGDCDETDPVYNPMTTWYQDADGDGYGDGTYQKSCTDPGVSWYLASELTEVDTDCDDTDADQYPGQSWYLDADGDGHSDGSVVQQCAQPGANYYIAADLIALNGDCDDSTATTYPGAPETVADGVDSDCNGEEICRADADGDGYGHSSNTVTSTNLVCTDPGEADNNTDCDDTDPNQYPGQTRYKDADGDGYSDGTTLTQCSRPTDYKLASELTATSGDCDDTDANNYPGNTEVCDGQDNDCDDLIDDEDPEYVGGGTYYADTDGDGYGDPNSSTSACGAPSGYVTNADDCNDADALEQPGQVRYIDADGDGYGDAGSTSITQCSRPTDGYVATELVNGVDNDCDDTDPAINPGAVEIVADGVDNNCDGIELCRADADGDLHGHPTDTVESTNLSCTDTGESAVNDDCDDTDVNNYPGNTEVCDGQDNDCDGLIDDADDDFVGGGTWYLDADGDGYGDPTASVNVCSMPANYVSDNTDCDDTNFAINPDTVWYLDVDGDGFADGSDNRTQCADPGTDHYLVADLLGHSAAQTTIDDGLVGYRNFDDGTANDQSGNGYHGGERGGAGYGTGKLGHALALDGVNDHVRVTSTVNIGPIFTVSTWVYMDNVSGRQIILGPEAVGTDEWFSITNGKVHVYVTESNNFHNRGYSSISTLSPQTWHHVAMTIGADDNISIYIDGMLDSVHADITYPRASWSARQRIGARGNGTYTLGGKIDDLRIYNRALSPTEVQDLYISTNNFTADDCDDADPVYNPLTTWYRDADGDGWSDGATQRSCTSPGATWYFGDQDSHFGIHKGYLTGNLTFVPEQWGGNPNPGEFDIVCPGGDSNCSFTTSSGVVHTPEINNGVACEDGLTGEGFIMYSEADIKTRLGGNPNNAKNYVCVKYDNGQRYADDNYTRSMFVPVVTDRLIASVDFGANTVTQFDDRVASGGDCDDTNASINPGATEICNEIDLDCSGSPHDVDQISAPECEALVDLYTSTSGDNWTDNTGWLTAADISTWHGIDVSNNYIDRINLYENNLVGALPSSIGQLNVLSYLNLGNNQLTTIPSTIGQLTGLQTLSLGENQITYIPAELGSLVSLDYLGLYDNQIISIPAELGQLASLKTLFISNNQLTSVPVELRQLSSLEQLNLSQNQLTSIPVELGQLSSLQRLHLQNNQLTTIPTELGSLTNLEYANLSYNQLINLPTTIGQRTNIQNLHLNNNQLVDLPITMGQLINVQEIALNSNELTSIPAELGSLTSLNHLGLYDNQLTSIPVAITQLTGISIPLENNNLSRTLVHDRATPSNMQTRYDAIPSGYWKRSYDQGDITPPVLTGQTIIPTTVTGAFAYTFEIDENSYPIDNDGNPMPISFTGLNLCSSLITADSVSIQTGQVTITITPTTEGAYENCILEVTDHGDEPGNGHSTANIGTIDLNTFCYGATYYLDADGDGYGDPATAVEVCGSASSDYVTNNTDCDDTNFAINPDTVWYLDVDGDGFADGSDNRTQCADPGTDHYLVADLLGHSAAQTTIDDGLVGYRNFDDGTATDSINNYVGTIYGVVPFGGGRIGSAVFFDGNKSNDITIGNPSTLQLTGDMTISLWLKPNGFNARRNPIAKAYGGEGTITQEPNGEMSYYYGTNGGNSSPYQGFRSSGRLSSNNWNHVVIVRDLSDTNKLYRYFDGVLDTSVTAQYAQATAGGRDWKIGHGYTNNYNGGIDDVRFYNRPLSPEEVEDLYISSHNYAVGDCDDTDPAYNPRSKWYRDADGDGYSDGTDPVRSCTAPAGTGWALGLTGDAIGGDCDDTDPTINPGTTEICNEIDMDCSGSPHDVDQIAAGECAALVDLYTSTSGDNRNTNTGWLTAEDIDTWTGISLSNDHVYTIRMDDNNIIGSLPTTISQLGNLETLSLRTNQLTSLPAEIGQLNSLVYLWLEENQLTSLPVEIGQLSNLEDLNLFANQLTTIPAEIGQLGSLAFLWLTDNQLTSLPAEIGQLSNLYYLNIDNNQLTSLPAEIGQLSDLYSLNISNNQITSLPAEIGQLSTLNGLYANTNQLTSLPAEIGQLSNLQSLYVSENQLTSLPVEIGQLSNLRYLYVDTNQLTSLPATLVQLNNLSNFYIQNNNLPRTQEHRWTTPSSMQSWYYNMRYTNSDNQGDITAPVLSNGSTIPTTVSGAFSYSFTIDENSYPVDVDNNPMPISFTGAGLCADLATSDSVSIQSGTVTITIDPTTQGTYEDCTLEVRDHGDEVGNGHSTANVGTIDLPTFCYGGTYYFDADGDKWAATGDNQGNIAVSCGSPGSGWSEPANLSGFVLIDGIYTLQTPDCNDTNYAINPATIWYMDLDSDGFADGSDNRTQCTDPGDDHYLMSELVGNSSTQNGLNTGLVGYRNFDDGDGTDQSGNGLDINNLSSPADLTAGKLGAALYPVDHAFNVSDNDLLDISDTLTISLWLNPYAEHNGYANHLIRKFGGTSTANFVLYYFGDYNGQYPSNNRNLRFYANAGGTWKSISAGYKATLHEWVHITLVYDASSGGQLYINGQAYGSTAGGGSLAVNTHNLELGIPSFDGAMDDIRIYDRPLSPAEVQNLYLSTNEYAAGDCNDDPTNYGDTAYPGATEVCDLIDNDCDGFVDELVETPDINNPDDFCHVCDNIYLDVPKDECMALVDIHTMMGGDDWNNGVRLWKTYAHVDDWYGVGVTSGHVASIAMPGNNVTAIIPTSIQDLTHLEVLQLTNNNILGLGEGITSLTGLEMLDVSNNQLTTLPADWSAMTALEDVDLAINQIAMLPASIASLTNLVTLDLDQNLLETFLPSMASGDLSNLQMLTLSENRLTGSLPAEIGGLSALQELDVSNRNAIDSGNRLTDLDGITALSALKRVDASNNMIDSLPTDIGDITTLQYLKLKGNNLTTMPASLGNLSDLGFLHIGDNQLTTMPASIAQLFSLYYLNMSENNLALFPSAVTVLTDLQYLYINDNDMIGSVPDELTDLINIQSMTINDNNLTRDAHHDAVLSSLLTGRATTPGRTVGIYNQSDIIAPTIVGSGVVPEAPVYFFEHPVAWSEESYAVDLAGQGMQRGFTGAANCTNLNVTPSFATGQTGTGTLTISALVADQYNGCSLYLEDHGGNISNQILFDDFYFSTDLSNFCGNYNESRSDRIPKAECEVLVNLFLGTNGLSWTKKDNRFATLDADQRWGVRTNIYDGQVHVDGLFLHSTLMDDDHGSFVGQRNGNNLIGILPTNLGDLAYLRDINLSNNTISGDLPASFASLTQLEKVYMLNNTISGNLPSSMDSFVELEVLHMGNNELEGTVPTGTMPVLQTLNLAGNNLAGTLPADLATHSQLKQLNLANNQLSGTLLADVGNLDNLQTLDLGGNQFVGTFPLDRSTLTLQNLDVSSNNLDRDADHEALKPVGLGSRRASISNKLGNQGDVQPPSISSTATIPWKIEEPSITYTLSIEENSYAVSNPPASAGMQVHIEGDGDCTALSSTSVTWKSGEGEITLTPTISGAYISCTLSVVDHGGNVSNELVLDNFVYGMGAASICFDPSLTIPTSECLALVALYDTTNGANRNTELTNPTDDRISSPDVDSWYGVMVTNGHVRAIDMGGPQANNLVGTLPDKLGDLTALQRLDLSENSLSGVVPQTIGQLTGLVELELAQNAFTGTLPDLGANVGLEMIDLSENAFVGTIPPSFSGLTNVETLDLSNNNLDRDIDPTHNVYIDPASDLATWISSITTVTLGDQGDIAPPLLTAVTDDASLPPTIGRSFSYDVHIDENSYATNSADVGMLFDIIGDASCDDLVIRSTTRYTYTNSGNHTLVMTPLVEQTYANCSIRLTDHGGNTALLLLPSFVSNLHCGDGIIDDGSNDTIDYGETCDEGLSCADGTSCTDSCTDGSECMLRMKDGCTPLCQATRCGDRYVDTTTETCDVGSYCTLNGADCSFDPSVCPDGASGCVSRATDECISCKQKGCGDGVIDTDADEQCDDGNLISGDGCSTSCQLEYCGDAYYDPDGPDNIPGTNDDEVCDAGTDNGLAGGICTSTCKVPTNECLECYETCDGGTDDHSIFLLIDISGSMSNQMPNGQTRFANTKQAAHNFVNIVANRSINNTDFITKIGVITFSGEVTTVINPTSDYQAITTAIDTIGPPDGDTNIGGAIELAKNYFATNDTNFMQHIVLLSDGMPTVRGSNGWWPILPTQRTADEAIAAKENDVEIYTVTLDQSNAAFMAYISSSTKLNYAGGVFGYSFAGATQSSTYNNDGDSFGAHRAIDGSSLSYSRTISAPQQRWEVDLGRDLDIEYIRMIRYGGTSTRVGMNRLDTNRQATYQNFSYGGSSSAWDNGKTVAAPNVRYLRLENFPRNNPVSMAIREIDTLLACPSNLPSWATECTDKYHYQDYGGAALDDLYASIFGDIHCGCDPDDPLICSGNCGDGVIDTTDGETCDTGSRCDDWRETSPGVWTGTSCTADPSVCADNDLGECRTRYGDGCTAQCLDYYCGDGVINGTEECDDGINGAMSNNDGCSTSCQLEVCGDGILQQGLPRYEECDDGNTTPDDGCSTSCRIEVDEVCGNGLLEGNETCDDGNTTSNDGCAADCGVESPLIVPPAFAGSCIDTYLPAVNVGEVVPLRRQLVETSAVTSTTTCEEYFTNYPNAGYGVLEESLQCTFGLYKTTTDGIRLPVMYNDMLVNTMQPCHTDETSALVGDAAVTYNAAIATYPILGGIAIQADAWRQQGRGVYTLQLDKIEYTSCQKVGGTTTIASESQTYTAPQGGMCAMDISVTDGYFTQKGAALVTTQNTAIEDVVDAEGNTFVTANTPLDKDNELNVPANYNANDIVYLAGEFVDEQDKRAIIEQPWNNIDIRRVPGENIIVIDGMENRGIGSIALIEARLQTLLGTSSREPFTLIVKGMDLEIQGDLMRYSDGTSLNGMYIVQGGDIRFVTAPNTCTDTQEVTGIFVTDGSFESQVRKNTSFTATQWCPGGNLHIKGVLIGGGLDTNFFNSRRTVIDYRGDIETRSHLFFGTTGGNIQTVDPTIDAVGTFRTCYLPALLTNSNSTIDGGACNHTNWRGYREQATQILDDVVQAQIPECTSTENTITNVYTGTTPMGSPPSGLETCNSGGGGCNSSSNYTPTIKIKKNGEEIVNVSYKYTIFINTTNGQQGGYNYDTKEEAITDITRKTGSMCNESNSDISCNVDITNEMVACEIICLEPIIDDTCPAPGTDRWREELKNIIVANGDIVEVQKAFADLDINLASNKMLTTSGWGNLGIYYTNSSLDYGWMGSGAISSAETFKSSKNELIYSNAAVLIETSAALWDALPPGAADLLDTIQGVIKQ